MLLRIDPTADIPLYRQIVLQVQRLVACGKLEVGDRVPSVRELAMDIRINPNTVARAYRELQALGLLSTVQGHGTFIASPQRPDRTAAREHELRARLQDVIDAAVSLQVEPERVREMLDEELRNRYRGSE